MEIIIFCLAVFAGLALARPALGAALILAGLPTYQIRFPVANIPTTFLEWMILLLLAATLIRMFWNFSGYRQRLARFFKDSKALALGLSVFLLCGLIAVLASPAGYRALGIYKAYFAEGSIFFLLCIIHLDSREKLGLAIKALGYLLLGLALFGVYQFFTLAALPPAWWGPGLEPRRVVSLYTYPNAVGLLITPILAVFTALLSLSHLGEGRGEVGSKFISKKFLVTVIASGVILLVLTFSRGAWLGYLAALTFLLLFTKYRKPIFAALGLGIVALLAIPASRARILPVLGGYDPAGLERFKLWQGAAEIIKTNPLTGAGLMGFREWYGALRQSKADEILNYPHNFFLNFWIETGALGLAAVIGALTWTAARARQLYRGHIESRPLVIATLAAWIALIVHGQFDAPFFKNDLAILFWFLLALVPMIEMLQKKTA